MSLRDLRKKEKYSQTKLANIMNVSQTFVSGWERSIRQPDISLLPKLAKVLRCSIEDIVYCFCEKE